MRTWREIFRKVRRKFLFGALLALLLLGLSGYLSFQNARRLIVASEHVASIHTSIAIQRELLARVNEVETGLFGFIITEQTDFLVVYNTATNRIPDLLAASRSHLSGHSNALQSLQRLELLIERRLALIRNRISVQQQSGSAAAAALVRNGEAKEIMDDIRDTVAQLTGYEIDRLEDMENRSMRSARATLAVDILFGTLSVMTLGVILAWLMRENVGRRESEEQLRNASRELEIRVAQRTADLATANSSLQREIVEHKRAEEALRASEQKLAEAAQALEEKNRELEMLIYVLSHDLRSPLLNVRGFVSELVRSCADVQTLLNRTAVEHVSKQEVARLLEDVPEAASFIQAAVAKMDTLLNGVLRLSRLGRAALRISRLDVNALMENVAQSFAFQLRQAGAELRVERLPKCMADSAQLAQVFSNLVDNAIKYREPGRPLRITISAEEWERTVLYHVADNGRGIAPEHAEKVFEIFYRVNRTDGEGEGLGLTIARRILDRLNGRLRFQCGASGGAVFTVELPSATREDWDPAAPGRALEAY